MATKPEEPSKPPDIFERVKIKTALTNRIMRALKDATDDDMRKQIIEEVAALSKLFQ